MGRLKFIVGSNKVQSYLVIGLISENSAPNLYACEINPKKR